MRRPDVLDPAIAADLDALDAALAGEADADPGLALFATELREVAPRPAPAFRSGLDARAARGFARPPRPRRDWGNVLKPALGFAVAATLVVLIVVSGGGDGNPASSGGGSMASKSAGSGGSSAASSGPTRATQGGGGPAAPPADPGRRVERDVRLDLRTGPGSFERVSDAIVRATQRAGGYVASSDISSSSGHGNASFVLEVPVERLDAAIAGLSRLAHVDSIEQSSEDVTGRWDTIGRRLTDARIERRALVAALATAGGDDAIRLRARLERVTGRLRALTEQQRALRAQTSYATIELTLAATRGSGAAPPPGGHWTPGDAWRDARRVLEVATGVTIVALAVLLPLALAGAGVALGGRAVRRRRREAALDS